MSDDLLNERDLKRAHDEIARLRTALTEIWEVGDGWGPNSAEKPSGTTGEGHHKCRWIARKALDA